MAICRIIETGATPEQYDQVRERVGVGPDNPPPGGRVHIAAQGEDGKIRVIEVWDSREQAEQWTEQKVRPSRQAVAPDVGEPTITYYDVHQMMVT
ncbi:MAG TPA: hypothetical protein VFA05_09235 [Gaiellaceae bacterium]|nr:hypothetical protein [Gaiellaceae bacterium]